ncbi:hypothetical protein I79_001607 [Cricetulus griseus]|uniref:Uncharacterized protein n=1 Tax=Cricetulus griseus TaxID=10029 RepID=G3GV76_CRIGR|nr:hypothetical protein I79_001607 [Cricetulus griseus]
MLEFLQQKPHSLTFGQCVPNMFNCFMLTLGNTGTVLIVNIKRLQRLLLMPKLYPHEYTFRTDRWQASFLKCPSANYISFPDGLPYALLPGD